MHQGCKENSALVTEMAMHSEVIHNIMISFCVFSASWNSRILVISMSDKISECP